jgi:lysosomal alpha-glucosidase
MNEPSNFVDGSSKGCTDNSLDEPPYIPKVLGGQLYKSTICPSSEQYFGNHYNLHNMYGHFEAISTSK